jgi:hypothetical protein
MKNAKRFLLMVILAGFGLVLSLQEVRAQGCIVARQSTPLVGVQCAGTEGTSSRGSGLLDPGRWQIAVGFRKQRSHRHFVGTEEQTQRATAGTEVVNNTYLYDVALTYAVNKRFNMTVGVPFQRSTRRRGTSAQIFHSVGIGDISLTGRMWLKRPPAETGWNVSFGLGLKLPTGKKDYENTVPASSGTGTVTQNVDQSIQLGDGGWGIPLDIQAYKRIGKTTLYSPADGEGKPASVGNGTRKAEASQVCLRHVPA